jgi:hypothetical protein
MKAVLVLLVFALATRAAAQSTIHPVDKFAYGANTGWINFRHDQPASPAGVTVGEYFLAGFAYAANFGWIGLGDGTPTDGIRYANNIATDCGVNHDGTGNLYGYAYGANSGWINFGWAGVNDPNRPRIDLFTGAFAGYAYSANTGWINLGTGDLVTQNILSPDTDGDGMADAWENTHFGNITTAGIGTDNDGDGQSDAAEYGADTDPTDSTDSFRIVSQIHNSTFSEVQLVLATTGPTRHYRIETTTDLLTPWLDSGLGTFAAGPGTQTTRRFVIPAASARFYRGVAIKPLQ